MNVKEYTIDLEKNLCRNSKQIYSIILISILSI